MLAIHFARRGTMWNPEGGVFVPAALSGIALTCSRRPAGAATRVAVGAAENVAPPGVPAGSRNIIRL